jgi:hypothetical protein
MIRTAVAPLSMALLLAAQLAVPTASRASTPGAGDDEDAYIAPLAVTADFNGDGIADIARVKAATGNNKKPHSLIVLLGRKDGSFAPETFEATIGNDPDSIVVGDFNHDGIPDVIVGDADGSLRELLGDGSGKLKPGQQIAPVSSIASIAVGDFNHDGVLDLAVSDSRTSKVTVLLGAGGGAFSASWSFNLPRQGKEYHLSAADYNGDGIVDLAVTEDDSFEVMTGNGNGTFSYSAALSHGRDPNAHCTT